MSQDVIIVGGGLTGISAAWELEQRRISYRLIEVKNRLGGSIVTRREAGFTLDGAGFEHEQYGAWAFLSELGLDEALVPLGKYRDGQLVAFREGTQTLVDAIERRLTAPIMKRMAVSSIGQVGGGFGICLENGLMLDARAVIVTAPARYAAHMLHSLQPDAALLLLDYRYDPVVRVSLGYHAADAPEILPDLPLKFIQRYTLPQRVPADHVLIRAGVRLDDAITSPDDALRRVRDLLQSPAAPVVQWAYYWAEADPLSRYLPEHAEAMDALDRLLPSGVVVAGSDYRAKRLDQQVEQGRAAARKIAEFLG